ncbi:hypothetical protein TNCV_497461 [Trichonephila clavipes]|nr:hypothetical protein TNCV_497461 [Trichonephila clavipes]
MFSVLTAVGMTSYTKQEMADIHFIYGVADGNALVAPRLSRERFPSRRLPNRKTFEPLHRCLREKGLFVIDYVEVRNPTTKARLLQLIAKYEERYECTGTYGSSNNIGRKEWDSRRRLPDRHIDGN